MMIYARITYIAFLSAAISGCSADSSDKQLIGAGIGAMIGGIAGSQFGSGTGTLVATGVGAIAGGLIGSAIGAALDEQDKAALSRNTQAALKGRLNRPVTWRNPENGHSVSAVAVNQTTENGRTCRLIEQSATVDGKKASAPIKKCKQPNGTWSTT